MPTPGAALLVDDQIAGDGIEPGPRGLVGTGYDIRMPPRSQQGFLHDVLGKDFITVYSEVKEIEHNEFMQVISPWEREHLLLHV